MTVNWYDVLDVAPDAEADEIRAAWKSAVAELDPTDRSFRVFNQAAEVLLDPKKRAAYDEELAASQAADPDAEPPVEEVALATVSKPRPDEEDSAPVELTKAKSEAEPDEDSGPDEAEPTRSSLAGWVPQAWLLALLAVLTALVVGAVAWLWFAVPSDGEISEATSEAQSAAERAVVPVLSFDHTRMDADQETAHRFMTSEYRREYDKLFTLLKQNSAETQTKVKTVVVASSVVRSGADRVEILLFVDRPITNKVTKEPKTSRDQATLTMQNVDGEWLVDDIRTKRLDE